MRRFVGWLAIAFVGVGASCSPGVERTAARGDLATGGECARSCDAGGAGAGPSGGAGGAGTGGATATGGSGTGGAGVGGTGGHAGGDGQGGSGGDGEAGGGGGVSGPVADFALRDVNPASPRFDELVSPRDYLQQVSAWYFGTAL